MRKLIPILLLLALPVWADDITLVSFSSETDTGETVTATSGKLTGKLLSIAIDTESTGVVHYALATDADYGTGASRLLKDNHTNVVANLVSNLVDATYLFQDKIVLTTDGANTDSTDVKVRLLIEK